VLGGSVDISFYISCFEILHLKKKENPWEEKVTKDDEFS
jgi:hypothetical protein